MTVQVHNPAEGDDHMTEATKQQIEEAILEALDNGHESAKQLLHEAGQTLAQRGRQTDRYRLRQGLYRLMSDGKITLDPGFVPCATQAASA